MPATRLRIYVGGSEKRGHFGAFGAGWSAAFQNEPFSLIRRCSSERPGAVKGAPLLGAAKRTLDREDRSGRLEQERKAQRRTSERWSQKMAPLPGATNTAFRVYIQRYPDYVTELPSWNLF